MSDYVKKQCRSTYYYIPELDYWCIATKIRLTLQKCNMTMQEYYDKYLHFTTNKCQNPNCNNVTEFQSLNRGYKIACCKECYDIALSIIVKEAWKNEQLRNNMSTTIHNVWKDTSKRIKLSNSCKRKFNEPSIKQQRSQIQKIAQNTKQRRQSRIEITKQLHADGVFDNVKFKSFGTSIYAIINTNLYYGKTILHNDKQCIWLPSLLEYRELQFIERLNLRYAHNHCKIKYNNDSKTYIIDYEIQLQCGKLLLECKPAIKIQDEVVQQKYKAALQFIQTNNDYIGYAFITESISFNFELFTSIIKQYDETIHT